MLSLLWAWDEGIEDNISQSQSFIHQNPSSFDTREIINVLKERRKRKLNNLAERDKVNLNSWQTDVDSSRRNVNMLEEQVTELDNKLHETDSKLSRYSRQHNRDMDRFERLISKLTLDQENADEKVASNENDIVSLQNTISSVTRQLNRVNDETDAIDSLASKVRGNELKIHNLTNLSQRNLDNAINKMKVAETTMASKDLLYSLQRDLNKVEKDVSDEQKANAEIMKQIRDAMSKSSSRFEDIEKTVDQIKTQQDSVIAKDIVTAENVRGLERQLDLLQENVVGLEISQLKSSGGEQEVEDLKDNLTSLHTKAQTIENSSQEKFNRINDDIYDLELKLQASVESLEKMSANTKKDSDNYANALASLEETVEGIVTRIDHIATNDVSRHVEPSTATENDINRLYRQIFELEQKLQTLETKEKPLSEDHVTDLVQTTKNELQKDLESAKIELTGHLQESEHYLRQRITDLTQKLDELGGNYSQPSDYEGLLQDATLEATNVIDEKVKAGLNEIDQKLTAQKLTNPATASTENQLMELRQEFKDDMKGIETELRKRIDELSDASRRASRDDSATEHQVDTAAFTDLQTLRTELSEAISDQQRRFEEDIRNLNESVKSSQLENVDNLIENVRLEMHESLRELQGKINAPSQPDDVEILIEEVRQGTQESLRQMQGKVDSSVSELTRKIDDVSKKSTNANGVEVEFNELKKTIQQMTEADGKIQESFNDLAERIENLQKRDPVDREYILNEVNKSEKISLDAVQELERSLQEQFENHRQMHNQLIQEIAESPTTEQVQETIQNQVDERIKLIENAQSSHQLQQNEILEKLEQFEGRIENTATSDFVNDRTNSVKEVIKSDLAKAEDSIRKSLDDLRQNHQNLELKVTENASFEKLEEKISDTFTEAMDAVTAVETTFRDKIEVTNAKLDGALLQSPTFENLEEMRHEIRGETSQEIGNIKDSTEQQLKIGLSSLEEQIKALQDLQSDTSTKLDLENLSTRIQQDLQNAIRSSEGVQEMVNSLSNDVNGLDERVTILRKAQDELPSKGDLGDLSEKIMLDVQVEDSIVHERLDALNKQLTNIQESIAEVMNAQAQSATRENLQDTFNKAQDQIQQTVDLAKQEFNQNIDVLREEQGKLGEKIPEMQRRLDNDGIETKELIARIDTDVKMTMTEIEKIQQTVAEQSDLPTKDFVIENVGRVEELVKQSILSVENNLQEEIGTVKNNYDSMTAQIEQLATLSTNEIASLRDEINNLHLANEKAAVDLAAFVETSNLMDEEMKSVSQKADMWQRLSGEMLNQIEESIGNLQSDFAHFQENVPGEQQIQKSIDDTINAAMLESEAIRAAKADETMRETQKLRERIEDSKARIDKMDAETMRNLQEADQRLMRQENAAAKNEVRFNKLVLEQRSSRT